MSMMEEQHQEIIHHFIHEHPLRWIPNIAEKMPVRWHCHGCRRNFLPGEAGYGCSVNCGDDETYLHEECAEMAREIRHPLHPSHTLTQSELWYQKRRRKSRCAACDGHPKLELCYICSRGCKFFIHLRCAGGLVAADEQVMKHQSHPQHELRFLSRSCPFKCDACGTGERGKSYICIICQYWIHESCASLPTSMLFHHHPDHFLSLAFILPFEYIDYEYTCGICSGSLPLTHWVYHCQLCRYVVHIKCATKTSPTNASNSIKNEDAADDDILKGPINDTYEELIKPFIKRERGQILIAYNDNEIVTSYTFHHHPLRFTLFSSLPSFYGFNNEEGDEDGDEIVELTCDGCTLPINQKKQNPSNEYESGCMSCGECKYFLHLTCFNLPLQIPSHPLHQIQDHHLRLRLRLRLRLQRPDANAWCDICELPTNGLFYTCTECNFRIDIKCLSLPKNMKHAGHPHDYLKLVTSEHSLCFCLICSDILDEDRLIYRCEKCKFFMCCLCALLPASNKHRWEKHLLPLTFDASVNHPDEFYCASCEKKMNPKSWMYHCRQCDQSFHPKCIPATSGRYRNINFGRQQYHVSHHPQHPLRFQLISKTKNCTLCYKEVYDRPGYQCTSCNFVMCLDTYH